MIDADRYAAAEARLFAAAGAAPTQHRVHLDRLDVEVRVQEVGEGAPALFLHGGPNSGGTWAYLAARVMGLRCLLLDRPGTGLSDPLPEPLTPERAGAYAEALAVDVLDALGIDRAHLVGSSLGGWIALRSAAAHPGRVDRMVQLGCPAFAPGFRVPAFMRALMVPGFRQVLGALPPNQRMGRATLKQIGHGASLAAGRIPQDFFDWYLAMQRHTDTMRNEGDMIARMGSAVGGFDDRLLLTDDQLGAVRCPTWFLWGRDDAFGGEEAARRTVAAVPDAQLELRPDAGHLPWLDDVDHAARAISRFLTERVPA